MLDAGGRQDAQDRKEDWHLDKVVKPKGKLFRANATLAAELGLARHTVPGTGVTDVGGFYGASEVKPLDPSWVDKLAEFLKIPAVTIILVMLGFIGLILELHRGTIRYVTTFEALDLPDVALSAALLDDVWHQLSARFAPPAAVLLCTPEVFESWIRTPHQKFAVLCAAAEQNAAQRDQTGNRVRSSLLPRRCAPIRNRSRGARAARSQTVSRCR